MSSNLNVDDFVLTMDKNKMQIGGYNIENSLSGTPLFKTYSNGEKSVTIPAGLYLLNNQIYMNKQVDMKIMKNYILKKMIIY